jgi:hypothetical protein
MSSIIIKRATIVINSICGFAITFSECSDDLSYLNRVMLAAGIALDNPQYIIVSYRGTAERAFVDADLSSCFHFFCGLHMVRNLKANRWTDYLPLFWKARNAPTRTEHHQCMDKIKSKCPPMFTYLDNADRWQLYLALESGRMLYDWKSDNIVEHIFAWCRNARFLNPFMFIKHVVTEVFAATNTHRLDIESMNTVLHPQALQHFEVLPVIFIMRLLFMNTVSTVSVHTTSHASAYDGFTFRMCICSLSDRNTGAWDH